MVCCKRVSLARIVNKPTCVRCWAHDPRHRNSSRRRVLRLPNEGCAGEAEAAAGGHRQRLPVQLPALTAAPMEQTVVGQVQQMAQAGVRRCEEPRPSATTQSAWEKGELRNEPHLARDFLRRRIH